jgi:hypothetical protein
MKKKSSISLKLNKQTITNLTEVQQAWVLGGAGTNFTCGDSCNASCITEISCPGQTCRSGCASRIAAC